MRFPYRELLSHCFSFSSFFKAETLHVENVLLHLKFLLSPYLLFINWFTEWQWPNARDVIKIKAQSLKSVPPTSRTFADINTNQSKLFFISKYFSNN